MFRRISGAAVALLIFGWCSSAGALTPETLKIDQHSMALLHRNSYRGKCDLGSAFCIDKSGLFLTTSRAVTSNLQLILNAGRPNEVACDATFIRNDGDLNLAVVQIQWPGDLTPFEFGDSHRLTQGMRVTTFDYALTSRYDMAPTPFPPVTVSTPTITVLHQPVFYRNGKVIGKIRDGITCDASLAGDQCGVPVLDDQNKVVGVVEKVVIGRNHSATFMPSDRILKFINAPQLTLLTGVLPYDKRHDPNKVVVNVASLAKPAPPYELEMSIAVEGLPPQTLISKVDNGMAAFSLVPLPVSVTRPTMLTAHFTRGSVTGEFVDREIRVNNRSFAIRDIRKIETSSQDSQSAVTFADGSKVQGKVEGLESIELNMGVAKTHVDLSRSHEVDIIDPDIATHSFTYMIQAKLHDVVVGQVSGAIALVDARVIAEADRAVEPVPLINVVAPGTVGKTPLAGGNGGNPIESRSKELHDVIGFHYQLSTWDDRCIVKTLEPIYQRSALALGETVIAREGYAVGGLLCDSDEYFHAARVIFMKVDGARLNPKDRYLSDWIGKPCSGQPPKQLAGKGEHVLGVCGRKGLNMDAVGLIIQP